MGLKLEEMRERWRLIWQDVQFIVTEILTRISEFILEKLEYIRAFWTEKWTAMRDFLKEKWNEILAYITEKITEVQEKIKTKIEEISSNWEERWLKIRDKVREIWDEIVAVVTEKIEDVREEINTGIQNILDWLKEKVSSFKDAGKDLIKGMADGVASAVGDLISAVTSAVEDALNAAKGYLGIQSPSRRAAAEVGVPTGLGVAQGIAQTTPIIQRQMVDAVGTPMQNVTNITQNMQRSYNLTTQSITRPGALAMEFSALEFASR